MTRKQWDRLENQLIAGKVVEFCDRGEFLYIYRYGRKFRLQTEDGYTLKSTSTLREMGQYLTARR